MATVRKVALVIPAWNEVDAIGAVLDEIPSSSVDDVLIVVGSPTDPTASVARPRGARVIVQTQPGYGAACWTGALTALNEGTDMIAFLDGDYSDPPAELQRVLEPVLNGRADLTLGRRDLRAFPSALPLHARLGNQLVLLILRVLLGSRFTDLPSFKAVRSDVLREMDMREMTYGWTVEMLVKASRAGLHVEEVPVVYRPRLGGRSKVAGSMRASIVAAVKLLGCAVAYATWRPPQTGRWSVASGH